MGKVLNDFIVDPEGRCFFCLQQISVHSSASKLKSEEFTVSSFQSLQYLSRFLKVDMRKVFTGEELSVPQILISKVERSRLKAPLCEDCTGLNEHFSKLGQQLEKIQMEMASCLNLIQTKLLEAEKTGRNEGKGDLIGKQEIVEALRKETIQKCSRTTKDIRPRVKIQNLTAKEIVSKTKRKSKLTPGHVENPTNRSNFEVSSDSTDNININNIKWESDPGIEMLDESESQYFDDLEGSVPSPNYRNLNSMDAEAPILRIFNRETGKHKCSICSKEFNSSAAWKVHYDRVHLQIKHKCTLCGKEFTQKCVYLRHHRVVHAGVKSFKCNICDQTFARKDYLKTHQQSVHFKQLAESVQAVGNL